MKTLILILALILPAALSCEAQAQIWVFTFDIRPTVIRQTPAHYRNHRYSSQPYSSQPYSYQPYKYGPYGGYNHRRTWTNYKVPDTSWGYRTSRPRAKDLGIHGPHKYGHPNPRSLYR